MPVKKPANKFQRTSPEFDIIVTKLVTVGHVIESDNGSLSPVEAAMALIGRDMEDADPKFTRSVGNYGFRVGSRQFTLEVDVKDDAAGIPMTDEWTS
jgi:hypothetical protein